jgi:hypothetical protein
MGSLIIPLQFGFHILEIFEFHIVNIFECLRYQMFANVAIMLILIERTDGRKKKKSDVIHEAIKDQ